MGFVSTACESESLLSAEDNDLLDSITASLADEGDPASHVIDSGFGAWCSVEPFTDNSPAPYIQLNFTRTIFLTHMTARGGLAGLSYVTEFMLEILNDYGEYVPYGVTDQPTVK